MTDKNPKKDSDQPMEDFEQIYQKTVDQIAEANEQIYQKTAEQIAEANLVTLGLGPAIAMVNSYMSQSHAQSLMFHNAVQQQSQEAITGLSIAAKGANRILDLDLEEEENDDSE